MSSTPEYVIQANKFTTIKSDFDKGTYLVATKQIPAYVVVACFGRHLVPIPKNRVLSEEMETYGIIWPFDNSKLHVCPNDVLFKNTYRANLVNEPYQTKKNKKVIPYPENVKIAVDHDSKCLVLLSLHTIKKGEELLWYYGRNYSQDRRCSYFVYPPQDEWNSLEIHNGQIISFEEKTPLPNWIGFLSNMDHDKDDKKAPSVFYTEKKHKKDRYVMYSLHNKRNKESRKIPGP